MDSYNDSERELLTIRGIYLRLSFSPETPIPETIALFFLPGGQRDLVRSKGVKIRSQSGLSIALLLLKDHRSRFHDLVYSSSDRVRVREGAQFEIYLREKKFVEGIFKKRQDKLWEMDCTYAIGSQKNGFVGRAEICVASDATVVVIKKGMKMAPRRKKKAIGWLDNIPEVDENESDGEDCGNKELDLEGLRWAWNVGIWMVCLGVIFWVSRASSKRRAFM